MNEPNLYAVVEITQGPASWVKTPSEPWPPYVRLCDKTSPDEIALVVHRLAIYNSMSQERPFLSEERLAHEAELVLPGGIACTDGVETIYPSCCAGLEEWHEWYKLLDGSGTPWLGHDPSPFVESVDDGFLVWPDGGLSEPQPPRSKAMFFSRPRLETALNCVVADLDAFISLLASWCTANIPAYSAHIAEHFSQSFNPKREYGA